MVGGPLDGKTQHFPISRYKFMAHRPAKFNAIRVTKADKITIYDDHVVYEKSGNYYYDMSLFRFDRDGNAYFKYTITDEQIQETSVTRSLGAKLIRLFLGRTLCAFLAEGAIIDELEMSIDPNFHRVSVITTVKLYGELAEIQYSIDRALVDGRSDMPQAEMLDMACRGMALNFCDFRRDNYVPPQDLN